MYPRTFFEKFWESKQRNELFVCMPFHDSFDEKFETMNRAAILAGFERATRVDKDIVAGVITDKIFDGIANARMLLFDLSDDPNLTTGDERPRANGNVLYELGAANASREPEDILLIRDASSAKLHFDIQGLTVQRHGTPLEEEWLVERLKEVLERQQWSKSRRVKAAAESIDGESLGLIRRYGRCPEGKRHFNSAPMNAEEKMSVLRLLDLGIIWCASANYAGGGHGHEYAYRWTPFGDAVIAHLGLTPMTEEEYLQSPQWMEYQKSHREYQQFRRTVDGGGAND